MQTPILSARRHLRAGFTLIELLAVIMIIGILAAFLLPRIPEAIDRAEVAACQKNLDEIYKGLMTHNMKYDDIPSQSGVKFFGQLITRDVLEKDNEATAKKLTCPGVKVSSLPGLAGRNPADWFDNLDDLDGSWSSYAGRNMEEYPLRKFPGSGQEPLVADDNDPTMNHRTETVVLYADGHVGRYDNKLLEEQGVLQEGEILIVGPESQVETLRKLSLD